MDQEHTFMIVTLQGRCSPPNSSVEPNSITERVSLTYEMLYAYWAHCNGKTNTNLLCVAGTRSLTI